MSILSVGFGGFLSNGVEEGGRGALLVFELSVCALEMDAARN